MYPEQRITVQNVTRAITSLLRGRVPESVPLPDSSEAEELRQLCEAVGLLTTTFAQATDFISTLSQGILDVDPPPRNLLISPFKQLRSILLHLTWQTIQVANGDLNQRVDFLGEFSAAFNSMIESLREKRLIEQALARSEERLGLALDGANLGLWDYDVRSGEVTFNRRWAEILEYTPEEMEPTISSWHERIHPDEKQDFMTAWEDHLAGRSATVKFEHRLRSRSGQWKWILSLGRVVDTDGDGSPSRMAGTFLDITDRKVAEAELHQAHTDLLEANTNILDSIHYARTIQQAFLPRSETLGHHVSDYFVMWDPRDVIGGDIFWFDGHGDHFTVAVMDCTGHGVPGAIMTMIAGTTLNRVVSESGFRDPALILERMNRMVKNTLSRHGADSLYDDGLDMGICYVDKCARTATFAGARIGLFLVKDEEVHEIKGDRASLGYRSSNPDYHFKNHGIHLDGTAAFYLMTDGFSGQIGDRNKFPLGKRRLKAFIRHNHAKPFSEQKSRLEQLFQQFKGGEGQRDDVTVLGFRV